MNDGLSCNKTEKKRHQDRENKIKLLSCYQAANDILSAWTALKKLPPSKSGKVFCGTFEERKNRLVSTLTFENPSNKIKRENKARPPEAFLSISINPDRTMNLKTVFNKLCMDAVGFYYDRLSEQQLCTESSDKALTAILHWAESVDPELDHKINNTIQKIKHKRL